MIRKSSSIKVPDIENSTTAPPNLECVKQEILDIKGSRFSLCYYSVPVEGAKNYSKPPILSEVYQCYNMVRRIQDYYVESGMGWDKYRKFEELEMPGMNYIMVKLLSNKTSDDSKKEESEDDGDDEDNASSIFSFSESENDSEGGDCSSVKDDSFEDALDADLSGFDSDINVETSGLEALDDSPKEHIPRSEKIVGFVSYYHLLDEDPGIVFLYELHVKNKYQGTGLAAILMDKYEKSSIQLVEKYNVARRRKSLSRVNLAKNGKFMLTVFRINIKARKFYRKLGYKVSTVMGDDDTPSEDEFSLDLETFDNTRDIERLEAQINKDALRAEKNKEKAKKRKRKSNIYKGWLELEKSMLT